MIQLKYIHKEDGEGDLHVDASEISHIRNTAKTPGQSHLSLKNGNSYLIPLSADALCGLLDLSKNCGKTKPKK